MFKASEKLDLPKPAFGMEQPDDPELYLWPAPKDVSANPINVNRPVDGYPSFWATSWGGLANVRMPDGSLQGWVLICVQTPVYWTWRAQDTKLRPG